MNDQIQKLAEELFSISYENTWKWEQVSKEEHYIWIEMAKYVIKRELQCRIDELLLKCNRMGLDADDTHERIEELTNQLQQLRGGNENYKVPSI